VTGEEIDWDTLVMYHEEAVKRARSEGEQMKAAREEQEAQRGNSSPRINLPPGM
jgi:hypothetical protein